MEAIFWMAIVGGWLVVAVFVVVLMLRGKSKGRK